MTGDTYDLLSVDYGDAYAEHSEPSRRRIRLTPASEIRHGPVRGLWDERLAVGTLGLLAGREGQGR